MTHTPNAEEKGLTAFGSTFVARKRLWRKPLNHVVPDLFSGGRDEEAKGEAARLAEEAGLASVLIGALALEDAFTRSDAGGGKFATGIADEKRDYLSLWEVVTKTFGVRDELSAELLCHVLFRGLASLASDTGKAGSGGNKAVDAAELIGVHGEEKAESGNAEKLKEAPTWGVLYEGRNFYVRADSVIGEGGSIYFFRAGATVASFPQELTAYWLKEGQA